MQNMVVLNAQQLENILILHTLFIFQELAVNLELMRDFETKSMEVTINTIHP